MDGFVVDLVEVGGPIGSLVTGLIAVVGLLLAAQQIHVSRELAAQTAYEAYHHLGLAHPTLATGNYDFQVAANDDREKYRWFVLSMLLTVERVLALFPNDRHWKAALQDDILIHHKFIASTYFGPHWESLDPRVKALAEEVLRGVKDGKFDEAMASYGVTRAQP